MIDVVEGRDFILEIPLTSGSEEIIELNPGVDSATFSITKPNGAIFPEYKDIDIEISTENTSVLRIHLPAEANKIQEGKLYNIRFLDIKYTHEGKINQFRRSYRIIRFVGYTGTEDDVRNLFGVVETVIPNNMIDLYGAYVQECGKIQNFDEKLNDFGDKALKANRAIVLRAGIALESALALIIPRIETDNTVSQTRFTLTLEDFKRLLDDLKEELNELEDELEDDDKFVPTIPFIMGELTDVFTGE